MIKFNNNSSLFIKTVIHTRKYFFEIFTNEKLLNWNFSLEYWHYYFLNLLPLHTQYNEIFRHVTKKLLHHWNS